MNVKTFHIGDVLSITTDVLLSPEGMGGVYKILNYMTGDELFTHQLPRAADECRPHLLAQHPWLAEIDASGVNESNVHDWLKATVERYGSELNVEPIPQGDHKRVDPVKELGDTMKEKRR